MATSKKIEAQPEVVVDMTLDWTQRPLTSADLRLYLTRKKMDRTQAISTFGFSTLKAFNEVLSEPHKPLPFEMEMLLRHLLSEPPSTISLRQPKDVFNLIYKDILDSYQDPEQHEAARVLLYERFTGMFARHVTSAYRWLKISNDGRHGEASATIRRLFAELEKSPKTVRETLERLARETHRCRGVDFDATYPMPSKRKPPQPRRPGPKPGGADHAAQGAQPQSLAVADWPAADSPHRDKWIQNRGKLAVLSITIALLRMSQERKATLLTEMKQFFASTDRDAALNALLNNGELDSDSIHTLDRFVRGSNPQAVKNMAAAIIRMIMNPDDMTLNAKAIELLTQGLVD